MDISSDDDGAPYATHLYLVGLADWDRSLSNSTLDALKEFYADREGRQKQFEELKASTEDAAAGGALLTMDVFAEDWNESQFWVRWCESYVMHSLLITVSIQKTRQQFSLSSCYATPMLRPSLLLSPPLACLYS